MISVNRVCLIGRLTQDPKVQSAHSGTAVADLRVAVGETYKNKQGETVETTCFVDVVVWSRQAEACGEHLSKGSLVCIEGRLQLDQWESREGEKRSRLRVRADRVSFLDAPQQTAFQGTPPAVASSRPAEEGG